MVDIYESTISGWRKGYVCYWCRKLLYEGEEYVAIRSVDGYNCGHKDCALRVGAIW